MKWRKLISAALICVMTAMTISPGLQAKAGVENDSAAGMNVITGENGTIYDPEYNPYIENEETEDEDEYRRPVRNDSQNPGRRLEDDMASPSDWLTASGSDVASNSDWPATASNARGVAFTEAGPCMPAVWVNGRWRQGRYSALDDAGETKSVVCEKTAKKNDDGSYTVTIDAYAESDKTNTPEAVDVVLIMDQCGTMSGKGGERLQDGAIRLVVAKDKASLLIDKLGQVYGSHTSNRMAIISFGNTVRNRMDWTAMDEAGVSAAKSAVSGIELVNEVRRTNEAMEKAEELLTGSGYPGAETGANRKKVVILVTDGSATRGDRWLDDEFSDAAVRTARRLKEAGVTIYCIGVNDQVNADQLHGDFEDSEKTYWTGPRYNTNARDHAQAPADNRFLNFLSSNYKEAEKFDVKTTYPDKNTVKWTVEDDDIAGPRTEGYFLAAPTSKAIEESFTSISEKIFEFKRESRSTYVLTDKVAKYFDGPESVEKVKVYTAAYKNNKGFERRESVADGRIQISLNEGMLKVAGFDYNDYFLDDKLKGRKETEPHIGAARSAFYGRKLIVEYTVRPKAGFLGGNQVPTHENDSGIYANDSLTKRVRTLSGGKADVKIPDIHINTKSPCNVYLYGSVNWRERTEVSMGEGAGAVSLNMKEKDNGYGLDSWQTEFITITDGMDAGTLPARLSGLSVDGSYTVTVKAAPLHDGSEKEKKAAETGAVNVFVPAFTVKQKTVYYGDLMPEKEALDRCVTTEWKHAPADAAASWVADTDTEMIGDKPELELNYTPLDKDRWIKEGKIKKRKGTASMEINAMYKDAIVPVIDYCYLRQEGEDESGYKKNRAVSLEIASCQLTVRQSGGLAADLYVFTILKDGKSYMNVWAAGNGEVTIKGLPVGEYRIEGDMAWAWRYSGGNSESITLGDPEKVNRTESWKGEAVCQNGSRKNKWLSEYSIMHDADYPDQGIGTPERGE
ncbi:MAG: VWA domain-containing protein [Eubacteriales bacterium]|nr:VWA domain-containing protein [Eubacteriales bacterium]